MVKEEEFSGGSIERERYDTAQRAVSPANLFQVFIIGVLRVNNEDIDTVKKLDQSRASGRGVGPCFVQVGLLAAGLTYFQNFIRLVVRQIGDRPLGGRKPIPDADTGVIHKASLDAHFSDREIHFL